MASLVNSDQDKARLDFPSWLQQAKSTFRRAPLVVSHRPPLLISSKVLILGPLSPLLFSYPDDELS